MLRASPTIFCSKYGEYFLYALILGGENQSLLSTTSSVDLKSEMRDIQVKAKVFWQTKTVYENHRSSQECSSANNITFVGFDSLDAYENSIQAHDQATYELVKMAAMKNVAAGIGIKDRIRDILTGMGIGLGETSVLTSEQCANVCASGLVVEALFLPYAGLRDYAAVASSDSSTLRLEREL